MLMRLKILGALSILFALTAAAIALVVATDSSTQAILDATRARHGMDIFGNDFDVLLTSIIADNRKNAFAAICAATSAILQGISLFLDAHGSFRTR